MTEDLRRIEYKYNKDFINFRKKMIKNKISYQKTILPKPVKLKIEVRSLPDRNKIKFLISIASKKINLLFLAVLIISSNIAALDLKPRIRFELDKFLWGTLFIIFKLKFFYLTLTIL